MSAVSHSYWTVTCDGPGCLEQASTDVWELATRREVRRVLERDGWAVKVKVSGQRQRQDFCPAHLPRDRWRHRRLGGVVPPADSEIRYSLHIGHARLALTGGDSWLRPKAVRPGSEVHRQA